ncbi:ABC transporter ATP-binding protein [Marinobacter confluentis]|uniref:ABC transporter ATP-binding protein n=1 Tax=Marinobacter confluentis TaxID=1697557 RepID=A0A4Z1CAJ8_9GAMM|nr:ABC transporter ATP-binding protein [Marinobacter confluentis]TGN40616.1 ABC transporter ATP-binding protein [Marinobacter confluentis]
MTSKTDTTRDGSRPLGRTLEISGLSFQWNRHHQPLGYPDVALPAGKHLFLQGPSGSGKSTLMSLIGGLIIPSSGSVHVLGTDLASLTGGQRDRFRADHMGVIFQQFNLVPYLNALDNVLLPCRLSQKRRDRSKPSPTDAATFLLDALNIPESHWRRPVTGLSVGQQQRVAAARALIGAPELILADEPTSALDSDNRDRFIELLLQLAAKQQSSVVFVSHDQSLAGRFDQKLELPALEATP